MKNRANELGFGIIDMMLAISIIGLLASITSLVYVTAKAKARDLKRVADVRQLRTALELYRTTTGHFPVSPTGTGAQRPFPETTEIPDLVASEYVTALPVAPPTANNGCSEQHNQYMYRSINGYSYSLTFCIGTRVGDYPPGYYMATSERFGLRFDLNLDGLVNIGDANYIGALVTQIAGTKKCETEVCDVSENGTITSTDGSCMTLILAGASGPHACPLD